MFFSCVDFPFLPFIGRTASPFPLSGSDLLGCFSRFFVMTPAFPLSVFELSLFLSFLTLQISDFPPSFPASVFFFRDCLSGSRVRPNLSKLGLLLPGPGKTLCRLLPFSSHSDLTGPPSLYSCFSFSHRTSFLARAWRRSVMYPFPFSSG